MNKNNNKMDLLGNAPVPQALMALGIPIMIGMLINALCNLVDAYFIGGLGESQMGAISIAFPLGQDACPPWTPHLHLEIRQTGTQNPVQNPYHLPKAPGPDASWMHFHSRYSPPYVLPHVRSEP